MNTAYIFPKLRNDFFIDEVKTKSEVNYKLTDRLGVVDYPIEISREAFELLQDAPIYNDIEQLAEKFNLSENSINRNAISDLYNYLDSIFALDSPNFDKILPKLQEINSEKFRYPVCSGICYPAIKEKLELYLSTILDNTKSNFDSKEQVKMIFAPHIDYRIGLDALSTYSHAFSPLLKSAKPDLVVMIGTGHYKSSADFMASRKSFMTPLGYSNVDNDLLDNLLYDCENNTSSLIIDEIAHLDEHSLELHLVFLQYIFGTDFKILPLLTGTPNFFFKQGIEPNQDRNYLNFINILKQRVEEKYENILICSSGDMAHFGKRFEDELSAEEMIPKMKKSDEKIIKSLMKADKKGFWYQIAKEQNKNKICGLMPFYAGLMLNSSSAKSSRYGLWNDVETFSAVSFASVLY